MKATFLDHTTVHFIDRYGHHGKEGRGVVAKVDQKAKSFSWQVPLEGKFYPNGNQMDVDKDDVLEAQVVKRFLKFFEKLLRLVRDHVREERKAAKGAARAAKIATEGGTCPCCFHEQVIQNTGTRLRGVPAGARGMVLHGYTRPGTGYTVGRCFGVGYEPFEVSCLGTERLVVALQNTLENMTTYLRRLNEGEITQLLYVDFRKQPTWHKPGDAKWDDLLRTEVRETERKIKWAESDIKDLTAKIAAWKPAPIGKRAK